MNVPIEQVEISTPESLPTSPLVSVYMLAYRHEAYIAEAIEGVLRQRCDFDVELIIGEDCSPDATGDIARSYQHRHPESIRLLTANRNIGMRPNAFRCLKACRGSYIAICEGDDYWTDPLKLQLQVELLAGRRRVMLAGHPARELDASSGTPRGIVRPALSSRLLSMHELILGDGGLIPSPSIMFRRELMEHLPQWYYDAPIGDFPLVLAAGLQGDVAIQNRCMAVYRRNVPASWSMRQGADFEQRWKSACLMDAFFAQFDSDTGGKFGNETRQLLSKLFSDALVRYRGDPEGKLESYRKVSNRLTASDRMFCALALHTPWKFAGLKTALRKAKSLSRMLWGEMTMPHV